MDRNLPRPGGSGRFVRLTRETYLRLVRMVERMEKLRFNKPLVLQDMAGAPVVSINWRDEVFIANVQKDGGSNGNATIAASWTYTIIRLGASVATLVPQERPRPIGTAQFQIGSSGFGLCFLGSDGKVHLWDAGEIYGSTQCPG